MHTEKLIESLGKWGDEIGNPSAERSSVILKSTQINSWFTVGNATLSLQAIASNFLNRDKLGPWLKNYTSHKDASPKTIGLVMAGNIPAVGFHDLLCVIASGHHALVKLSSKDRVLIPWMIDRLSLISSELADRIKIVDRLKNFHAVIATGSNNSNRYFEYYFGGYPHIFRKNRNAVAVLSGNESPEDIEGLGKDVFTHFGLGCRNVSKIYIPSDYDLKSLLDAFKGYDTLMEHNHYKNNYDYNRTLLILNNRPHYASDFLMLVEDEALPSPLATLHFEYFRDKSELGTKLSAIKDQIQCLVANSNPDLPAIPFGTSQEPGLSDYADGMDTMAFLSGL